MKIVDLIFAKSYEKCPLQETDSILKLIFLIIFYILK